MGPCIPVILAQAGIQDHTHTLSLPLWTPDHVRGDNIDDGYADTAPPQDEICEGGENIDT
jgi:hypothetical protein